MKGTYEVKVSNSKVSFTLELKRNITVIQGNSATGKTTLIGLIRDYEQLGRSSGVTIQCRRPCRVLSNVDWEYRLAAIHESIVFLDEGNEFVRSYEFAQAIRNSDNYYVIINRENLYQLPYSVDSILKLKTTSRRKVTYIRSYPEYTNLAEPIQEISRVDEIITEDSNSGYEMFSRIAQDNGVSCLSANGKSNVFRCIADHRGDQILVVADGAAFGAEMQKIHMLLARDPGKIRLYLPESFEWLVLKSGILENNTPHEILEDPGAHIESAAFFSWEQYFTALLMELTADTYLAYHKSRLNQAYLEPANVAKIVEAIAE